MEFSNARFSDWVKFDDLVYLEMNCMLYVGEYTGILSTKTKKARARKEEEEGKCRERSKKREERKTHLQEFLVMRAFQCDGNIN
jgi:hypothetical protein